MAKLRRVDGHYEFGGYDIEEFNGRWYIFNGPYVVADGRTLNEVRAWLWEDVHE